MKVCGITKWMMWCFHISYPDLRFRLHIDSAQTYAGYRCLSFTGHVARSIGISGQTMLGYFLPIQNNKIKDQAHILASLQKMPEDYLINWCMKTTGIKCRNLFLVCCRDKFMWNNICSEWRVNKCKDDWIESHYEREWKENNSGELSQEEQADSPLLTKSILACCVKWNIPNLQRDTLKRIVSDDGKSFRPDCEIHPSTHKDVNLPKLRQNLASLQQREICPALCCKFCGKAIQDADGKPIYALDNRME